MTKKKNLLGNVFGKLKVIGSSESKNGRATWICKCECGNIRECTTKQLTSGKTLTCKECAKYTIDTKSEIGKKYGEWTIIKFYRNDKNKLMSTCKCSCGTIKDVVFANIKNGSSTNCGCIRKMKMSKYKSINSLVGKKYGKLTVVEEVGKNKYGKTICKCKCDCGNTVNVLSNSLRIGHTTSCGCSSSRYPTIIKNELKNLGYNSKLEKTVFLDNDFISWVRFDVYVDELRLAIEYDGEPHFKPIDWSGNGIEEAIKLLERTQIRDEIKNKYCYDNDIFILRIPFTEKENIKNLLIETIKIITCND